MDCSQPKARASKWGKQFRPAIFVCLCTPSLTLAQIVETEPDSVPVLSTGSNGKIFTQKHISSLRYRKLSEFIRLLPGAVEQDGRLHIRGGRVGEIGYFVNGAFASNPFSRENNVPIIPEAIETLYITPGMYSAAFGGGNSAIVQTALRRGGKRFHASLDYLTDDFAHSGDTFLGTSSFGLKNTVLTLGGPIGERGNYFMAAQRNTLRDHSISFVEPFRFELIDDGQRGRAPGEPLPSPLVYKRNFLPRNWHESHILQGTLAFAFENVELQLTGSYDNAKQPYGTDLFRSSLTNYYNLERSLVDHTASGFLHLAFEHDLSPSIRYNLAATYSSRTFERQDAFFEDDWMSYVDRDKNAMFDRGDWLSKFQGPSPHSVVLHFVLQAPGSPNNNYARNSQIGIALDGGLTMRPATQWQVQIGGSYSRWRLRLFEINNIAAYMVTRFGGDGMSPREYPDETARTAELSHFGRIKAYGYDIDGKRHDEGWAGPREPSFGALFMQNTFHANKLTVNAGLRFERIDLNAPAIVDLLNAPIEQRYNYPVESELVATEVENFLLPRLDATIDLSSGFGLAVRYGQFVQTPALRDIYQSLRDYFLAWQARDDRIPFGYTAKPEKITQYEIGLTHAWQNRLFLAMTYFNKNSDSQLAAGFINPDGSRFDSPDAEFRWGGLLNHDELESKGLEFSLTFQPVTGFALHGNYGYSKTDGLDGASLQPVRGPASPIIAFRGNLVYEQTHHGNVILDYRAPASQKSALLGGLSATAVLRFNSGHPYLIRQPLRNLGPGTPWNIGVLDLIRFQQKDYVPDEILERTPWNYEIDLRAGKAFRIGKIGMEIYLHILNLLNRKNIINVFPTTGEPDDDGWLTSPLARQYIEFADNYEDFYRAINLQNHWAYELATGNRIYGSPRQLRAGLKIGF